MLNLFSKTKNAVKKLTETQESITKTIEKVHYEFDSASERLLQEAKDILSKKQNIDKGERLKSLGFISSAPAVASALETKIREEKEKVSNSINYFQQWYPNNKFITESEVERICKQYGLLFGEATYYKGDIPEKNLAEIESFKLREEDMQEYNPYMERRYAIMMINSMSSGLGALTSIGQPKYNHTNPTTEQLLEKKYRKASFKICAPEKDFDTRYMTVQDGYKLQYDPVVLQPVNNGYLIISKWGLEGEDESLVNEKLN